MNPKEFAIICFLVLMENGNGVLDKSPDYIAEKISMLGMGEEAFGKLDIHNMRKVKVWCDTWKMEMPSGPADYLARSEEAVVELRERGVEI